MELYVKVSFWFGVISVVLLVIRLVAKEYPFQTTNQIGDDIFKMLWCVGFCVWSGILVYGGGLNA